MAPLFFIGGTVVRAVVPRIISKLMQQGAKRATASQIKKAGGKGNIATLTNLKQVDKLKPKTPKLRGDRRFKPMDIKPFKSKGTDKGNLTPAQTRALQQRRSTAVDKDRRIPIKPSTSVTRTVQKGRGTSVPVGGRSGRDILQGTVNAPKARPSVPTGGARSAIGGKARGDAVIKQLQAGLGAALLAKKQKQKSKVNPDAKDPRGNQIKPTPGVKKKATTPAVKDPRGNQIKPTPGKMIMPKKFDGGYNKETQRLVNITVGGKKATYEIPKGMTTSMAKKLLEGTAKKKTGGGVAMPKIKPLPKPKPESRKPKFKSKSIAMPKIKPRNPDFKGKPVPMPKPESRKPKFKGKPVPMPKITPTKPKKNVLKYKTVKKKTGTPTKYKGFSKLPEKVQKKMSPKLASQYKTGGSVKSGCARQVKGFGAARRPKK